MVTLEDIRKCTNIHNIPDSIIVNKGIMLDYRLAQSLEAFDEERSYKYDFDIYLPTYGINLQRPYVWERYQQVEFIMSILLEKPLEPVVVVEHTDGKNDLDRKNTVKQIIDGKQRLLTIQKFLHNEFPIRVGGKEAFWNDFDSELKFFFQSRVNYGITATVYYSYEKAEVTDDMKIILFNYYNFSGTPQTEEHKNKLQALLNNNE